jgi:hypothetical protein
MPPSSGWWTHATCRKASWGTTSHSVILCRRRDDMRHDAWPKFVSVASYGIPRLIFLYSDTCVDVGTIGVAALGVGLTPIRRMSSRISSLYSDSVLASGWLASRHSASLCKHPVERCLGHHFPWFGVLCRRRNNRRQDARRRLASVVSYDIPILAFDVGLTYVPLPLLISKVHKHLYRD